MSEATNPTVRQERDEVPLAALYAGAITLALLLATGWFFTWIGERAAPAHIGFRSERAPVRVVPREIDMVDQTLFSAHLPSRGDWEAKRRALESYGWADRDHRLARIPIGRAMELLVERGHVE